MMQHKAEGWPTGPRMKLTLPQAWFLREERMTDQASDLVSAATPTPMTPMLQQLPVIRTVAMVEVETAAAVAAAQVTKAVVQLVIAVLMGTCAKQHRQQWAAFWHAKVRTDETHRDQGQEGSASWWGGSGLGIVVAGSLEIKLKLLVACHLWG